MVQGPQPVEFNLPNGCDSLFREAILYVLVLLEVSIVIPLLWGCIWLFQHVDFCDQPWLLSLTYGPSNGSKPMANRHLAWDRREAEAAWDLLQVGT